jgi:O-antigen/teichoic acid export membrane protein
VVNAGTGVCGPILDMTGHARLKLANSVLWTAILLGASAVLIPRWGVAGAATASMLAVSTVNLLTVAEVWVLERMLPFDRTFWKPAAAGLGALATGIALRGAVPVGADVRVALLQSATVAASYAALILVMGLAPEDRAVLDRAVRKSVVPLRSARVALALARRGVR